MRLGMISTANDEPSVAVAREGEWVPLRTAARARLVSLVSGMVFNGWWL
jgi:hypothetical protein